MSRIIFTSAELRLKKKFYNLGAWDSVIALSRVHVRNSYLAIYKNRQSKYGVAIDKRLSIAVIKSVFFFCLLVFSADRKLHVHFNLLSFMTGMTRT